MYLVANCIHGGVWQDVGFKVCSETKTLSSESTKKYSLKQLSNTGDKMRLALQATFFSV